MQHSLDDLIKYQEAISVMRENLKNMKCEHCSELAVIVEESLDDDSGENIGESWGYCIKHANPYKLNQQLKKLSGTNRE